MRLKKLLFSAAMILCISVCLCTSAFAADLDDVRFKDKTWDQVMEDFLADHQIGANQITAAYYNTVTGEEHFINKDTLMYGASMAKLPANMVFAERVSNGEMTMETPIRGNRYDTLMRLSIVNSDNPAMETLVRELGGGSYANFRHVILPYIGVAEEDATPEFLARNFFTPEQILHCLKLLYGNSERFPQIEEYMKQASPYDYFKQNRPPYTIAHKYGWYTDRGITYLNDCAIVYTDDPILIVLFTANVNQARQVLADYCSLMCDYTQYHRTLRYSEQALEDSTLALDTNLTFFTADNPEHISTNYHEWQMYVVGAGCALLVIALIVLFKKKLIALFLLLIACVTIVAGGLPTELACYALINHTPEQVLSDFESDFRTDSLGIEHLSNCDSAMASREPSDYNDAVIHKIQETFSLKIGTAHRAGNYIAVPVSYTKADLTAIHEDAEAFYPVELNALLKEQGPAELFAEDGTFRSDLMQQAEENALNRILEDWDSYLHHEAATLHLSLDVKESIFALQPVWKIVVDESFLSMINY